jgi:hypothetical protein
VVLQGETHWQLPGVELITNFPERRILEEFEQYEGRRKDACSIEAGVWLSSQDKNV